MKHSLLEDSSSLHSIISENTPVNSYEDMDIETAITERTKVQHGVPTNPSEQPEYHNLVYGAYQPSGIRTNQHAFRNITNLDSHATFARLNAERLKTITSSNELACDTILAPKRALADALADHIYKVTNQKPSTARLDEILTNKIAPSKGDCTQKENQWWQPEKDSGQGDDLFDYYMFPNM